MNANSIFAPVNLAEAAYLSGLSRRDIDRVIDERIVPDAMIASGGVRMINAAACALARFYFETATTLTATAVTGKGQEHDGGCATLTVTVANGMPGYAPAACWSR